jgi:Protein of unknown function (DUF4019)
MTHGTKMCVTLVTLLALAATALAAAGDEGAAKAKAQAAAEAWLAQVDAGSYAESWDEAAALFRKAITKDAWKQALEASRAPLGAVKSRRLRTAEYYTQLPGAPDGEYVVLQYDTVFEKKATAVETITPALDADGHWRVSGYYIR